MFVPCQINVTVIHGVVGKASSIYISSVCACMHGGSMCNAIHSRMVQDYVAAVRSIIAADNCLVRVSASRRDASSSASPAASSEAPRVCQGHQCALA